MWKKVLSPALLSGLLASVLTSVVTYCIYTHQMKSSKDSLMMGIAGEVESIKDVMEKQLRTAKKAEVDGSVLNKYTFYYPREYYDSVIADVGKYLGPGFGNWVIALQTSNMIGLFTKNPRTHIFMH